MCLLNCAAALAAAFWGDLYLREFYVPTHHPCFYFVFVDCISTGICIFMWVFNPYMFYIIASFVIDTCNKNACRFHPLPWFSCWLVLVYITDKINYITKTVYISRSSSCFLEFSTVLNGTGFSTVLLFIRIITMFARIFMFVLFRLYMYDMDNVYVCIVLTKWSNKNKFFFFFFFFCKVPISNFFTAT